MRLNQLIAEKVMGWKVYSTNNAGLVLMDEAMARDWGPTGVVLATQAELDAKKYIKTTYVPEYSTSIEAAWEVVENVQSRESGWIGFQLNTGPGIIHENQVYRHSARFFFAGYRAWDHTKYADSTPMAICLAALRSVGGLTDQEITAAMEAK